MEPQTIILPVIALVISGLVWNNFGYFSALRKNHNNPEWKGFEFAKLRNDLILGLILGVGAVVLTIAVDGIFPPITTAQEFLLTIWSGFAAVAAVDKFIVGGLLKK